MSDDKKYSFDIESTTFKPVIKKIQNSGKKAVRFNYEGTIHTVKENIPVTKIQTLSIIRDYGGKVGDFGQIEVVIPFGVYVKRIYPYRTNLEFTIKRREMQEEGEGYELGKKPIITRYKALFLTDQNPVVNAQGPDLADEDFLDVSNIVTMKLQIVDRSLEILRVKTTYGVYKNFSQATIIKAVMLHESEQVLIDGKPSVDGIELVDPDNKDIQKHVLIPHGTKIINLPTFLQDKCRGVYSAGIGTYLQLYKEKKLWFVFPIFDTKRFSEDVPKAIYYALPGQKLTGSDRTFNEDGKLLQVIITSDRSYKDQADIDNMNDGNGMRQSEAKSYMHKPIKITEDGPVAERTKLNREYNGNDREDGMNFAPIVESNISSNPFYEQSKVVARTQGKVIFNWENSDPELLYPGMPSKYVYSQDGKPIELQASLVGSHTFITLEGSGINQNTYRTMTQVFLTTETISKIPKVKDRKFKGNI